jgi:hypothetical protein
VKKVAVFGNAGGGKIHASQAAVRVNWAASVLFDTIQFKVGGAKVPHEEYL